MQVYVDESGDPGMKGKPGSSPYFFVAAVLFDKDDSATECRRRIRRLHDALDWSPRQEFKFNKCDNAIKASFFSAVSDCDFKYVCVALNKAQLTGPGFQQKEPVSKYATRLVFTNATPYLQAATVVMDQCGSRELRGQLQQYLKEHTAGADGVSRIKSVRTEKSHACELVQLADMVVGAIARSFSPDRKDANTYRITLKAKELLVQLWPC